MAKINATAMHIDTFLKHSCAVRNSQCNAQRNRAGMPRAFIVHGYPLLVFISFSAIRIQRRLITTGMQGDTGYASRLVTPARLFLHVEIKIINWPNDVPRSTSPQGSASVAVFHPRSTPPRREPAIPGSRSLLTSAEIVQQPRLGEFCEPNSSVQRLMSSEGVEDRLCLIGEDYIWK